METDRDTGSARRKVTLATYLTGFLLAIGLTLIPFGLVVTAALPATVIIIVIITTAIAQILVHLHYFLHVDNSPDQRSNLFAIVFTLMILIIMAGGTLWILYNLHYHMIPR